MPETTYAQLSEILRSLGFTLHEPEPGVRVYKHTETGALLVLPKYPDEDRVYGHHLTATKMSLDGVGIASGPEIANRLLKAS